MNPIESTAASPGTEIISTRLFSAPREILFDLFADPEHLEHWWGPEGFTNTFHRFDFEPDGAWRFTMHGPDGTDYENAKDFVEIIPPERVVFDHVQAGHDFRVTMTYTEEGEGTRLSWQMVFALPLEEGIREFIINANEQNFDRLREYLVKVMP